MDSSSVERDPVSPANFTAPHWEGTRERRLLLQFCPSTGNYQFYPRPLSLFTARRELEWRESPGLGQLYSFTLSRVGPGRFSAAVPYLIGLIELDEGVRIMGGLVGLAPEECRIGMRMKPSWLPLPDGYHLLQFQAAE